ncbi:MAG: hypothetical protein NT007_03385 [Candidatus Kapabacteria bacterium]|nr:hypothetical protein [Candidatus Kapabacteria bacterium]
MIKEFAIEPEFFQSWERIRYIDEKFGASNGRLISKYPGNWIELVYENLNDFPPMLKKRCEVKLGLMKTNKKIVNSFRQFNREKSWINNAVEIHYLKPFNGIIGLLNQNNVSYVLTNEDLDEENEIFRVNKSMQILREPSTIADSIMPLLLHSKDIIFIDPHFEKLKPRHIRPLLEIIDRLARLSTKNQYSIKYFTGNSVEKTVFCHNLKNYLEIKLPINSELKICRCPIDIMHNRFVLTDIGGISFSQGLDDNDSGHSVLKDDISLLDTNHWKTKMIEYNNFQVEETYIVKRKF